MNEFDEAFARLAAYGRALAEVRAQRRERRRLAANASRRRRYAARRAAGTLPSRRPPIRSDLVEDDAPATCYCHTCVMPPCSWCEQGGDITAEEPS